MLSYVVKGSIRSEELNELFSSGSPGDGWPAWQKTADTSDWQPILDHCLTYVTARSDERLVGFVHVAWDGRDHAFLLDPRVRPEFRHQGIGVEMVRLAARASAKAGCEWLHVDYVADVAPFYEACGFQPTAAGLIRLG